MKSLTKIVITIIIGAALAAGLYFVLIGPSLSRLGRVSDEWIQKKREAVTLEQQILAYRTAQSDLSRADQKDRIAEVLVDKQGLVKAVEMLEGYAATSGTAHSLSIVEEQPQLPASKGKTAAPTNVLPKMAKLTEVRYQLTTANSFAGTVEMLKYLEHLPQFTEISRINLSAELLSDRTSSAKTGRVLGSFDGVFVIKNENPNTEN